MKQRDPIVFVPCEDRDCHYFREYRMRFDQKGKPYGLGMDSPADALALCNLCKRRVPKDFYWNLAEETDRAKGEAEPGKASV